MKLGSVNVSKWETIWYISLLGASATTHQDEMKFEDDESIETSGKIFIGNLLRQKLLVT